jgi:hypothetical protein
MHIVKKHMSSKGVMSLAMLVVLLLVLWAVAVRARVHVDYTSTGREQYDGTYATPAMLYTEIVNGNADLASSTGNSVMLYKGWKTPSVELDMTRTEIPLTVTDVGSDEVSMSNVYDLILTGNFVFDEFSLHPVSGSYSALGTRAFSHTGGGARSALLNLMTSGGSKCPGWKMRLRQPGLAIEAHDVVSLSGAAGTPIIPEICKAAALTGLSTSFTVDNNADITASILVIPYKKPPLAVSMHLVEGKMFVVYSRLDDHISSSVNAISDAVGADFQRIKKSRQSDNILAFNVGHGGEGSTTVRAEFVRGRVRVCFEQGMLKKAYYCEMTGMLNDPGLLESHPLHPPQIVVRSVNAHDMIVLPFAVGDLSVI